MKAISNSFTLLGVCLALAGLFLSLISQFVLQSTPLTALGLSTIILGSVCLSLGRGQPKIPPEASAILLQSGVENISAIVEELGLKSKAIYLPSSMTAGKPKALVPLHSNPHPPKLGNIVLPERLIVKHGPEAEDIGLLVTTPGSAIEGLVTAKADSTESDLEAAISLVLSSTINLADGVQVTVGEGQIKVEVSNPRLEYRKMWVYQSLGSPLASIVASVVAEVLDKPVSVEDEQYRRGKCVIELKLTGRVL
ncbi:MAG: hypothetical protein NWF00_09540 [Candidatus Bathyarchaeota archaeon]|nr:hypothetical protein [Candidatus Bathyarchaeota archaeon]